MQKINVIEQCRTLIEYVKQIRQYTTYRNKDIESQTKIYHRLPKINVALSEITVMKSIEKYNSKYQLPTTDI